MRSRSVGILQALQNSRRSMVIASIEVGLAVDNTIHYHAQLPALLQRERRSGAGCASAAGMLVTSVVLPIGFFIYSFATMKNVINFGLLTSFAIVMALVADYFITPALMVLINPKKVREETLGSEATFTGLQPEPEM